MLNHVRVIPLIEALLPVSHRWYFDRVDISLENGSTIGSGLIRALVDSHMNDSSSRQFGLLVAYVLPGFIGLGGLAPILPAVAHWLRAAGPLDAGLGAPVYAVMAATVVGMIISCFRWILLDSLLTHTGVHRPAWDDRQLPEALDGFDYIVQNHFRYYEFAGNTLLALLAAYLLNRSLHTSPFLGLGTDLGMLIVLLVLFAASRDALAKYYTRTGRLLGPVAEKEQRPPHVQR